jgi:hypothetical protein
LESAILNSESLFSSFSRLDIGVCSVPFDNFSVVVERWNRTEEKPAIDPVETAQASFDLRRLARSQHALPVAHEHVQVIRVDHSAGRRGSRIHHGRRKDTLESAVAEIGENVTGVPGDVASLSDLDRLYESVDGYGRKIDAIFANAGVAHRAPFGRVDEKFYDLHFNSLNAFIVCAVCVISLLPP